MSSSHVLKVSAAAGGGLLLSFVSPSGREAAQPEALRRTRFAPNALVRIDREGTVTLVIHQVEMGQGTYTAHADAASPRSWTWISEQVRLEHAPPDDRLYANPALGFQATGGSTSVRTAWTPLRRAGATARTMLVAAAAADVAGRPDVLPRREGRRDPCTERPEAVTYGQLVDTAATLPVPGHVALKDRRSSS